MSISDSSTRSVQIVGGSQNVTFTAPNTFTVKLPASGFRTGKDECAMKSLTVYYSWPNISAAKGNNAFSYVWNGTTFPVVLDDGIWNFSDVLDYLQQVMVQNGHYLVDAAGRRVYYIKFVANPVLYSLSVTITPLPSSLPADWTNPAGVVLSGNTPQLVLPAGMTELTGFSAGTYPAAVQTALYQVNSTMIPQITNVTAMNVTSNIVASSGLSLFPNVLANFVVPNDQISGSLVQIQPVNMDWVPIHKANTFSEISVSIVDQAMRPVVLRDPAGFVCILNIRRVRD